MALLDSMLAENFHAAYRQKRSGVLTAEGASVTMRFCFQDGSPIAIDLGDHKDRLLAHTLRDYNRLTEEQLAEVLADWEAGKASVADLVVAHTHATEEEVGRTTQAMVEDCLCRFFSGKIKQVSMDEQKTIDGFDFDSQAFRLKIDAEVLLRTIDNRVADIRTIQQEFGTFEALFAFNEDSPGSGTLNDYEKRILDYVDGKTPIHQIAIVFRDSDLNTARTLSQLSAKRIIRRLANDSGHSGPVRSVPSAAAQPTQAAPPSTATSTGTGTATAYAAAAAMREATPTMRNFTPYRHTLVEEPKSRFMTVVLGFVLVLLCVIGVLVYNASVRRAEFQAVSQKLDDALTHGQWANALEQIEVARTKAGKDLSAQEQVTLMEGRYQAALTSELKSAEKLIKEGEYRQAATKLSALPAESAVDDLRNKLTREETDSRNRSQALLERIVEQLDTDDGRTAASLIANSPLIQREKTLAIDALDRWRVSKLELANSTNAFFSKRLAAIALVRSSEPTPRILEQVTLVDQDIVRQKVKITEQLTDVKAVLDKGDIVLAKATIDKLELVAQVEGTMLSPNLQTLMARIAEINGLIEGLLTQTSAAVIALEKPELLVSAESKATELTVSTLTGVAAKAVECVALLKEISQISTDQAPDAQIVPLQPLLEQKNLNDVLAQAIKQRMERLRAFEGMASASVDNARAMARDGKIEEAVKILQDLLQRSELRSTSSRATAAHEVDELKILLQRRATLKEKLKTAIAQGDVASGTAIAREMGLKYLPLSIESLPSGAEVWHEGQQIGTTPLVLDINAADRVDYQVEIKAPGFVSASTIGAKAEAGWRLMVRMEREPIIKAQFGGLVTNHPVVIDDQVVAASRSSIGMVDATGAVRWHSFAGVGVDSPIYSAAVSLGENILLSTRDQVALSIDHKDATPTAHRVSVNGRTDFSLLAHKSALIVDRRYLIVAGLDGAVHATDDHDTAINWTGPSGAKFMCAPALVGDVLLTARQDGTIERLQADDGKALSGESLGVSVVAAWVTPKGLAGYTLNDFFEYDGTALVRTVMPQPVADGVQDLVITPTNRVLVRGATGDRAWDEVGRLDEKLTGTPLVWQGHAVLPTGTSFLVLGKRGFRLRGKAEFLSPVLLKERLVAITQDGDIQQFDP